MVATASEFLSLAIDLSALLCCFLYGDALCWIYITFSAERSFFDNRLSVIGAACGVLNFSRGRGDTFSLCPEMLYGVFNWSMEGVGAVV